VYFGDGFTLHWLWKETYNRLSTLERAVAEGRAVDEASNFGRWLVFSDLYDIFNAHPQAHPMEVDGLKIRELGDRVVAACGKIYRGGKTPRNPSQSTVDEINSKMDVILSHLAKNISPVHRTVVTLNDSGLGFAGHNDTPGSFHRQVVQNGSAAS
jgi:hypothetical protein